MDDQGIGGIASTGRVGSPTVVDITKKLELLCELFDISRSELKRYFEKAKIDPRTVDRWFNNPPIIRGPCREAIVHYFQTTKGLPFNHNSFMLPYVEFETRMRAWKRENRQESTGSATPPPQNQITISLADAASHLSANERGYICGKYQTYRLSASDTTKVVTEVVSIQARADSDHVCDVTMYCNKVDGDSADEDTPVEVFIGSMFKFGSTYMIIITYTNGLEDKRPRAIQFPILQTLRREMHFGIITGYSVVREDHFSGRILARKISRDSMLIPVDRKKVRRVDASNADVREYAAMVEADPSSEGEKLMTVNKQRMVAFVRRINGAAPL